MRHSTRPEDTGVVSMDRAGAAGQKTFEGVGYRLAAGGLGRRWTPSGGTVEEPCLEDEFVAHTARAWTRLRGVAAHLPGAARAGVSIAAEQVDQVNMVAVCQATALCAVAAIGASTALYWQKSRTARVDHEIVHVAGEVASAQAQTGRLRAQWLALNEPARLQDAAGRYSGLRPLAPAQFVDTGQLADHLPAPGAVPADGGADAVPAANVAGDAVPVFRAITAQAASTVVPASPVDAAAPTIAPARPSVAAQTGAADGGTATQVAETMDGTAAVPKPAPQPRAAGAMHADAGARMQDPVWESPRSALPRVHALPVARQAAPVQRVLVASGRAAVLATIRAPGVAVRIPPPLPRAEPKPHAPPRMLMARFDMPRWLLETHASHPAMVVMSAPPHALTLPHDTSVLEPGAKHTGEPSLAVRSETHATRQAAREPQVEEEQPPAPVYRQPAYRPYYGYGDGYGSQYGYPYQQAPRYYPNPYGGYASQPYGGGPYYQ